MEKKPTTEQLRLAQLHSRNDQIIDDPNQKAKIELVMSITQKPEDAVATALYDTEWDTNLAAARLIEGDGQATEWEEAKKGGKKKNSKTQISEDKEFKETKIDKEFSPKNQEDRNLPNKRNDAKDVSRQQLPPRMRRGGIAFQNNRGRRAARTENNNINGRGQGSRGRGGNRYIQRGRGGRRSEEITENPEAAPIQPIIGSECLDQGTHVFGYSGNLERWNPSHSNEDSPVKEALKDETEKIEPEADAKEELYQTSSWATECADISNEQLEDSSSPVASNKNTDTKSKTINWNLKEGSERARSRGQYNYARSSPEQTIEQTKISPPHVSDEEFDTVDMQRRIYEPETPIPFPQFEAESFGGRTIDQINALGNASGEDWVSRWKKYSSPRISLGNPNLSSQQLQNILMSQQVEQPSLTGRSISSRPESSVKSKEVSMNMQLGGKMAPNQGVSTSDTLERGTITTVCQPIDARPASRGATNKEPVLELQRDVFYSRSRLPPPSKIPATAVEMPGDYSAGLDVQFGSLDLSVTNANVGDQSSSYDMPFMRPLKGQDLYATSTVSSQSGNYPTSTTSNTAHHNHFPANTNFYNQLNAYRAVATQTVENQNSYPPPNNPPQFGRQDRYAGSTVSGQSRNYPTSTTSNTIHHNRFPANPNFHNQLSPYRAVATLPVRNQYSYPATNNPPQSGHYINPVPSSTSQYVNVNHSNLPVSMGQTVATSTRGQNPHMANNNQMPSSGYIPSNVQNQHVSPNKPSQVRPYESSVPTAPNSQNQYVSQMAHHGGWVEGQREPYYYVDPSTLGYLNYGMYNS